jgi:hypothetical protein
MEKVMRVVIDAAPPTAAIAGSAAPIVNDTQSLLPAYEQIPEIGEFLVTQGVGLLSFAELIQIASGVYVTILIFKTLGGFKLAKWAWRKMQDRL